MFIFVYDSIKDCVEIFYTVYDSVLDYIENFIYGPYQVIMYDMFEEDFNFIYNCEPLLGYESLDEEDWFIVSEN